MRFFDSKDNQPMDRLGSLATDEVVQSVPERIEKTVRLYPDRLAVKAGDRALTYDDLNRYANRIALAILEKRGPGSEPIVLLFEHGIDVIAAILGVLKSGKFFVALDPLFPAERMNLIIHDSQARLIVTNSGNRSRAGKFSNIIDTMLNVDDIDSGVGDENLDITITPETISSILYTSGSTGTPKGVIDTHRNILESSRYRAETLRVNVDDRLSLLHSLAYASGRINLYLSLFHGASLFLFDLRSEGVEHLAEWLKSERVSILHCPVALFRQFAELHNEMIPLSNLRVLHFSGAPITRNDFELYKKRFHDGVLLEISMGSTEARGIGAAVLNKHYSFPNEGNPVGYAPPNKTILILDSSHKALPAGEVGEIAVQGQNLNPGYWRMPELTNAKYLSDPSGGDKRIYLTGDLGMLLPDGFLIHLGRKDSMVKIRGYRVDIGEVERFLLEHPSVKEAAVAAWDREADEKYLAGYVVADSESATNVSDLREFLSEKLPDYMVPSAFVFLDSLPLTNGKLDRQALPKPGNTRPGLNVSHVAPRTQIEQTLSKIWSELLSVDRVGVDDNFFDLGGHSLAGAAILTRVNEVFGVELAVTDLLERPTVALMAEAISRYPADHVMPHPPQGTSKATIAPKNSIRESSDSFKSFPREEVEQSIPERFEKIVRLYPDRVAVKAGDRVVTYSELNAMADHVASALVNRTEPVGILLDKSVDLFATMIGVLKAGRFFVLLDASFPQERIRAILLDAQVKTVVVSRQSISVAQEVLERGFQVVEFESVDFSRSLSYPLLPISANALAYITYTSGSTGQPKGVVQTHRNILHDVRVRTNSYRISPCDRVSLLASGTSNAIKYTFYTLLNGAALFPFDVGKEGLFRLASLLSMERISVCRISSSLFRKLCETVAGRVRFRDLRLILVASDKVQPSDIDLFKECFSPDCQLATGLSSSETGVLTDYLIDHGVDFAGKEIPVGYPVEDQEILVVGEDDKFLGFNQVGEIVVRSRFLSPGYWRRRDLTEAKFKPDPQDPQKRLFYTGDLGLMLPDGCLIHKGRKDFRVKIRGYSVDIDEVERALRNHRAITDAVVLRRENNLGETHLIAYFSSLTEPIPTTRDLREFLSKSIPNYMIPSAFVRLTALPLALNGKVDRRALPEPAKGRPELEVKFVKPRTEIEHKLATIWEEILDVGPIGIDDNFFDLGGHSLVGAAILTRVKETFGVEFAVSDLLQRPTVALMAEAIGRYPADRIMLQPPQGTPEVTIAPRHSIRESSDSFKSFPRQEVEQSIPERFEKIVRLYPDQVAVKAGDRALTYNGLNGYANRIARAILERRGPGSEPIALLFEHGIDVIAAFLGVLKAGKFYVALDPSFPRARLEFVLRHSEGALVLTNHHSFELAEQFTKGKTDLLNVDEIVESISTENLGVTILPTDLVNIRYTSGSTGLPKGVTRSHRSSSQVPGLMRVSPDDRFSLIHSLAFGTSAMDLYLSLLNGASTVLFDVKSEGVQRLASWLRAEQITICHLPPELFRELAKQFSGQQKLSSLRLIRLSGAPIGRVEFELYRKQFPSGTLLEIGMGSTEAGLICSATLDQTFAFPTKGAPIGYPVRGIEVLLLDENGREVRPGEIGEIAVSGSSLAFGYWKEPELTSVKFLPDPTGGDQRVYLTGDLGRMLPDRFLIHLGRKDLMVKIRGYRVNLTEVEGALLEHAQVKEAGVAAWDRDPGEKYLVGYVVPNPDSVSNVSELREFLSNKLPDYMVPSAFIFLDSLPLTNGKLDRSALPKPDNTRPELSVPYVAPRTPIEQTLLKLWSELLSVDQVGVNDNFFDLGGHSLAGAAILTRVKETFGVEFAVTDLLQHPTVALMAEAISRYAAGRVTPQLPQGAPDVTIARTHSIREPSDSFNTFPKEEVEKSIPERFEKIVRLYPDRIAIEAGDRIVTYSELNTLADRVARSIVSQRGAEPEPVALLINKGVEQIAAMLGVLKAGKFFVPLDSSYSLERMSSIIEDSQAAALMVDRQTIEVAQQIIPPNCRLIPFHATQHGNQTDYLKISIPPHRMACLVYTSGSTGKPKGVMRDHRGLLHGAMLRVHTDSISSADRLAHITAGTSNAVTNSFYVLLQGATLVPFDVRQEGIARLAGWLVDAKITICLIASPVFRKLCATLTGAEKFSDLRYLRLRSDTVYKSDVELFKRHFPPTCLLANGLASSETGPLREYRIGQDTEFPGPEVPVGYALEDKEILIVDDYGKEVGFNEIGEIVVRSKYLSIGYWNNAQLTETKFKPDPYDPEKRSFYTGDLGLMLADACLVHKGRKDSRVKVRGYAVDLIEVERALLSCKGMKEVVVVSQNRQDETRLVAFYTTDIDPSPTVTELRENLQDKLTDYMVPSSFLRLDKLPLTLNGKVDRNALSVRDTKRPELTVSYAAPRSELEERLAQIWAKCLGIDRVGVDDNFFDLGGHSLAGATIISRVKEMFGVEFPISDLFQWPTVAEMSEIIVRHCTGNKARSSDQASAIAISPNPHIQLSNALTPCSKEVGSNVNVSRKHEFKLPPEQQAIRHKCFHPSGTFTEFPIEDVETSISERFEKIVRLYPDRLAVKIADRALTYNELNQVANRIARAVIEQCGCESEPIVLLTDHGLPSIISCLGILKAGKIVVAIDPLSPQERIAYMFEDSGASVMLTETNNFSRAVAFAKTTGQVINIDEVEIRNSNENLGLHILPDAPAQLRYTSGSTSRPKGVLRSHRRNLHSCMLTINAAHIGCEDRLLVLRNFSFGMKDIFNGLLSGAAIVPFDIRKKGFDGLAELLNEEKITYYTSTPSTFRYFMNEVRGDQIFPSVRLIQLGGEPLSKREVDAFKKHFTHQCMLMNQLSSNETGPLCQYVITTDMDINMPIVPVGYPVDGKEISLIDENGQEVGQDQVGEIAVKSPYLSSGYWGSPELTVSKFYGAPYDKSDQLYLTGDLARWLPDGRLVYLGHKDDQIKIRGFTVGLNEIQAVLFRHCQVSDAAVVAWDRDNGDKYLAAYVVSQGGERLKVNELRDFLKENLPDYMIPSVFILMESLPLTNGKLHRKALPKPDDQRPELSTPHVAPRSSLEKKLVQVWQEVLNVRSIGVHDNFFDLGGHSLLGARLVSLIHEELKFDLPVSGFFASPTIAELAEHIETESTRKFVSGKKAWSYLCKLQRGTDRKLVFVFPGGGGGEPEFFVYGFLARHVGAEYPVYGLRARGADGTLKPHTSVEQMADAYVEEIRAIQPEGPYFLVGECAGGVTAYEAARQLQAQGQEVAKLVLMDVERPTAIKYLRFRLNRWLNPMKEVLNDTVWKWWRENYYLARLPHHLRQLRSLALREYPNYLAGRIRHTLKAPEKKPRLIDSRRERAEVVLYTTASGDALRHIEWVRENYRRTVRRFHPKPYNGDIEIIVSEKLSRRDPTLGWKKLALKGLSIHLVPGDHWSYIREHVAVVGPALRTCLEKAETKAHRATHGS